MPRRQHGRGGGRRRWRTPDRRVEERVRARLHHRLDAAYVRAAFARDERRAARTVAAMLASGVREVVNDAMDFVEEAVVRALPRRQGHRVLAAVLPALRGLLLAPDQNLRWNAVVTLGRVGPATNWRAMEAAFPFYLERDPLALPRLLQALAGLRGERYAWDQIEVVSASPLYLARWSLMELVWSADLARGGRTARRIADLRSRLASDAHPLVRAEARGEEELGFFSLRVRFWNYLRAAGHRDYDPATLDAFAHYLWKGSPASAPDSGAEARAFEAWRAQAGPAP